MTTPELQQHALAKANLTAVLLRADPTPVSKDAISHFHTLLDTTLTTCSPANIQNSKRWIIADITTPTRARALAKYLSALAPVLASTDRSSARRKRLHLLYLINDVLHHTKFHTPAPAFADAIKDVLPALLRAALTPRTKGTKQLTRLQRLLALWRENAYYPASTLAGFTAALGDAAPTEPAIGRKAQLLLPPAHGDPTIPFYDLPAGNLLPHITPNETTPINPRFVKPVQFSSITPTPALAAAVERFLTGVDANGEPDEVGGVGTEDEGVAYYGWSKTFCGRMREKKRRALESEREGREGRRGGRSVSRSSSPPRRRRSVTPERPRFRRESTPERPRFTAPHQPAPPPPPPPQQPQPQQQQQPFPFPTPFFPQQQQQPQQLPWIPPPPPPPPQNGVPVFPGFPAQQFPGFPMQFAAATGWQGQPGQQQQQGQQYPQPQQPPPPGNQRSLDPRKPWGT